MLLMFGVGLHFSLRRPAGGAQHRAARARSCRSPSPPRSAPAWRLWWGWTPGGRAGVRPGAVGGQHRGAAAGAGEPAACSSRSTAASPSAGWSSRTWRWCWCWCCCRRWRGWLGGTRRRAAAAEPVADARAARCCRSRRFVALMLVVGRRVFPWLLWQVARTGSRELFTLCVVAAARRHRLRLGRAVRRVVRARRVLRRHGAARVRAQPPRGRGDRCRCATPSRCCSSSRSACCSIRQVLVDEPLQVLAVVAIIVVGKSLAAAWPGAAVPLPAATPR